MSTMKFFIGFEFRTLSPFTRKLNYIIKHLIIHIHVYKKGQNLYQNFLFISAYSGQGVTTLFMSTMNFFIWFEQLTALRLHDRYGANNRSHGTFCSIILIKHIRGSVLAAYLGKHDNYHVNHNIIRRGAINGQWGLMGINGDQWR